MENTTINEDSAGAYASGLKDKMVKNIQKANDTRFMCGTFNASRLKTAGDNIFNYKDANKFAEDVKAIFQQRYPDLFRKFAATIGNVAHDYAVEKMKTSKLGFGQASVVTESYFNY